LPLPDFPWEKIAPGKGGAQRQQVIFGRSGRITSSSDYAGPQLAKLAPIMSIPPLFLGRVQTVASFSFLMLFLAVILALAWVLLYFKLRARGAGESAWTGAYRFWVRVYALAFVLALACCVPVLAQLGGVWSGLMDRIGNLAGPLLAFGILSIFALKSCFLGVMLFGQRRVSEAMHSLSVFMVALGQLVAVFWIVELLSWMQTPAGAVLVEGHYQVYDWSAALLNPSLGPMLAAVLVGAALTGAFLMLGITAWQALRRPLVDSERLSFRTALVLACIAIVLALPTGVQVAQVVARYQPAKAAAVAAYWDQDRLPGAVLFAWPDEKTASNLMALVIADHGGRFVGRTEQGAYLALENFTGMMPPVALTFWSARILFVLVGLMFVVAWITLLLVRRRGFDPGVLRRGWLHVLSAMTFAGGAAVVASWVATVVGLQPYAVNGAVTQQEILGPATTPELMYGTVAWLALYIVLLAAFLGMLFHAARYGVVPVRKNVGSAS
jgi:cytochrome d ubiquinol oxidase subunit I